MNRRRFCLAAAMIPALHGLPAVAASLKDGGPVTMVVPFSPGGNLDTVARAIAPELQDLLGTTVVVENKPGAGGVIGAALVARAKPDGHTLLVTTPNAITVAPFMTSTDYTLKDFTSVGEIAAASLVVVVNPQGRFKTMRELLEQAHKKEGSVTMGHAGLGTTNHIALLGLEDAAGCKFTAVPYKGSAPAVTALLGQQVDAIIDQVTGSYANIKAGKLHAIAVLSAKRDRFLPDVPTLAEAGVKGFTAMTQAGLLAPAKTPKAVIAQLNSVLNKALQTDAVQQRMTNSGSTAMPSAPEDFQHIL